MSKYAALRDHLRQSGHDRLRMSFDELKSVVPGELPPNAYRYDAWWSNESELTSAYSQSRLGWMAAGYCVETMDHSHRVVTLLPGGIWARP